MAMFLFAASVSLAERFGFVSTRPEVSPVNLLETIAAEAEMSASTIVPFRMPPVDTVVKGIINYEKETVAPEAEVIV